MPTRCPWLDLSKPDYVKYHDEEWGVPVRNDHVLYGALILEGAQAGLSWYTVLRKKDNYRALFAQFDPNIVANFSENKINKLLTDPSIIRNRLKIQSAILNARCFLKIQKDFGSFSNYLWNFVCQKPIINFREKLADYPTTSKESDALSEDLKKRGFSFVGSTIIYSYMQAVGLVNDHAVNCFRRQELLK